MTETRQNEGSLAQIIETSPCEIYIFDVENFYFDFVNREARQNLGFTQEQLCKLTFFNLQTELTRETFAKLTEPLLNGRKEKVVFKTIHERKDRSHYGVEVCLQREDYRGKPCFISTVLNIVEEKNIGVASERLLEAYELSQDMIGQISTEGKVVYINPAMKSLSGVDELSSAQLTDFHTPEQLERLQKQIIPIIIEKGSWKGELNLRSSDGKILPCSFQGICHRDSQGKPTHFTGIFRDLNTQKEIERELKRQNEVLEFASEETNDGWWDWKIQENYEYMSPRFWKTFGIDPKTKKHSPDEWQDLIHPDDLKTALDNFDKHNKTRGEHPYYQEVRYKHSDGHWATVLCRGKILEWDSKGTPIRMVGAHTDLSKMKEQERKLIELGERFKTLWENAQEMFSSVDPNDATVKDCNNRLCEKLGYKKREIIGSPIFKLYHEDCHDDVKIAFNQFVKTGNVENAQLTLKTKNGKKVPVILNVQAVRDKSGKILYSSSSWTDVSELVRINEELKRSNEDLDDFAYMASHDLKSPLRGIDNLAHWVLEDNKKTLSDESVEDLKTLRSRVSRMDDMLDGLLRYSRVDRGTYSIKNVSLRKMVSNIRDLVDRPDEYSISCDSDISIKTYKTPLEVVLRNLIGNSIKHRSEDTGSVLISCIEQSDYFQISVRDDGPGIPEDQQEKVFGLFKTLKPKDEFEASGMGLAIVKRTVEKQGGTIVVFNNNDGPGTTFSFTWKKLKDDGVKTDL